MWCSGMQTERVGHVGWLPALYSAEFVPFGKCSFLLCCWQPGKEEVTRVLSLVLEKLGLSRRIPCEM